MEFFTTSILANNVACFRQSLSRLTFQLAMTQVSRGVYHDKHFSKQCRRFQMEFITIGILASNDVSFRWSFLRITFQLGMTLISDGVYHD
jgi:hypothetical protein